MNRENLRSLNSCKESKTTKDECHECTSLIKAIIEKDEEKVRSLVEEGVNINEKLDKPILNYAVFSTPNILKILLQQKDTDPNITDCTNSTALHYATSSQLIPHVQLLLQHERTDPNIVNIKNVTPFKIALYLKNQKIIQLFLDCPKLQLKQVILSDCPMCISYLHKKGRNVQHLETGDNSLIASFFFKKIESARSLLSFDDTDVNCHNTKNLGETPLHIAVLPKFPIVLLRLLLLHPRIDVNSVTIDNTTPLLVAAKKRNTVALSLLLENPSIKPDIASKDNKSPFKVLCSYAPTDLISLIVNDRFKIDYNRVDKQDQMTPLMAAIQSKNYKLVKFLIKNCKGLDPLLRTEQGTAFGIAVRTKETNIIDYMFRKRLFDPNILEKNGEFLCDVVMANLGETELCGRIVDEIVRIQTENTTPNKYIGNLYS